MVGKPKFDLRALASDNRAFIACKKVYEICKDTWSPSVAIHNRGSYISSSDPINS